MSRNRRNGSLENAGRLFRAAYRDEDYYYGYEQAGGSQTYETYSDGQPEYEQEYYTEGLLSPVIEKYGQTATAMTHTSFPSPPSSFSIPYTDYRSSPIATSSPRVLSQSQTPGPSQPSYPSPITAATKVSPVKTTTTTTTTNVGSKGKEKKKKRKKKLGDPKSSESSGTDSNAKEEGKINRFTDRQALLLVNLWMKHHTDCESSRSSVTWGMITDEVNKVGPHKSKKQVKRKMTNLKLQYKKAKQNNSRSGRTAKTSKFYDEIDSVLGSRDVMTMPAVVSAGFDEVDVEYDSDGYDDVEVDHVVDLAANTDADEQYEERLA